MKKNFLLAFLFIVFKIQSQVFVTASGAGNRSGSSWANASTLQNAVTNASSNSQIWLKAGTYNIISTLKIVNSISNVKFYGGFAGSETSLNQRNYINNVTILDGGNTTQILIINGSNAEVNGITFRNGYVTGTITGGENPNSGGGAILIWGGNSVLKNCRFLNNNSTSERGAGAVYIRTGGGHLIDNCEFDKNKNHSVEGNGGGAIHNWDNNVTISNSKFTNNSSVNNGGAIYTWTGNIKINNCVFEKNHSDQSGGAIHTKSILRISNSVFKSNSSDDNGGAIYNDDLLKVTNSLFHQNSSDKLGGGIFNSRELYVSNSTMVANQGSAIIYNSVASTTSFVRLTHIFNSIFYNNIATVNSGKMADIDHSGNSGNDENAKNFSRNIFQENTFGTANLVGIDPKFQNLSNGNFNVQQNSPGYNYGNNTLFNNVSETNASNSKDLAGNPRVFAGTIDLGAYEFHQTLSSTEISFEELSIYPNPTWDILNVSNNINNSNYKIFNSLGQLIAKGLFENNQIDVKNLIPGVYIVQFETNNKIVSKKFIKK